MSTATRTRRAALSCALAGFAAAAVAQIGSFDGDITDTDRDRSIPYRVFFNAGVTGPTPVILVSHGGGGSNNGYTRGNHLGSTYAANGYLAIHIGHRESAQPGRQTTDRPADVSFILDRLEDGSLPLPPDFHGLPNLARIGHAGHSFGAYTAHAVGGAVFTHGSYRDERIDAICPLSPQGSDQFGAFDEGPDDNTWAQIPVPVYSLIGELELSSNALGQPQEPLWRLRPFFRYDYAFPRYVTIIPGADHNDLWSAGGPALEAYIAENTRLFFDIHLRGSRTPSNLIGTLSPVEGTQTLRKTVDVTGDGRLDVFDILGWFELFGANDLQAEATGDFPISLDIFDVLAFFEEFGRRVGSN